MVKNGSLHYLTAFTTLAQNENITLFIMGFTTPKTPVPPNAENEIQSLVGRDVQL